MDSVSIQTPAFISYCLLVQGRMAGVNKTVYDFSIMVRGQYNTFIKTDKLHSLTKPCKCIVSEDNEHDEYAVNNQL